MHVLIVVDMQVGCFAGEPPRLDAAGTVSRINALAQAIRPAGRVIFIQHTEPSGSFARGSYGWQLLHELEQRPEDLVVEKCACDAFLETTLDTELVRLGATELFIVGCASDFCVDTTVRTAAGRGYAVTVPSDAHTTRDRPYAPAATIIAHHNYVWSEFILPRGRTIRVVSTAQLLAELAPG